MATNQSRTAAQLSAAVLQLGFPDPDGGVTLLAFLNNEYKSVAGERRWEWLQSTFTFSVTAGMFSYAVGASSPGDVRNFDALWITDAADLQYKIRWAEPLTLLDWNQNETALTVGAPRYWTVWGGNILFYPTPDKAYTATVAYTKSVGDVPLTGSDRPLFPGDYDMILVWVRLLPVVGIPTPTSGSYPTTRHSSWTTG